MKTFIKIYLITLIICQIKTLDPGMVLVKNLTGNTPGGIFKLGTFPDEKNISVTSILPTRSVTVYLMTKTKFLRAQILPALSNNFLTVPISTYIVYLFIHGFIPQFSVKVMMDDVVLSSIDPFVLGWYNPSLKEFALHKFIQVKNDCTIQADKNYFSVPYQTNTNTWLSFYNFTVAKNITKGVYLIEIYKKAFDLNYIETPYVLPLYSKQGSECQIEEVYFCKDGYWAYPTYPDICRIIRGDTCSIDGTQTVIKGCKNNVLNDGQNCDYVGIGCGQDCLPTPGYQCFANNTCKVSCGNSIVQTDQQCDNGNKPGCVNCKIVPPYRCKNQINSSSLCFICGNSLYEAGKECENGNKTGCINCTIDRGYTCINKLNSISKCKTICGDGIWISNEECDNGNTTGCINCIKGLGYTCKNTPLSISKCYKCGNYIREVGQDCDNANTKGCKNCVTQPGWNCKTDPRYCYLIKKVCGNGQRQIQESCDDGNKENGDGCNSMCRTQSGYSCLSGLGEKSVCTMLTPS